MRAAWHWNRVFFMTAALAAAGVGGFLAVRTTSPAVGDERVGPAPAPSDPATAADEQAIQKGQSAYVKAFNAGDARALASLWTADGEFVDAEGRSFRGRSAIEKDFAAFFAREKNLTLEITSDSLRFVSPTVALESGTARVNRPAEGSSTRATFNIVHTRHDGKWLLASVREAPYAAASSYDHLRDLEWLVGTWTARGGGQTLELVCEWAEKRNFLLRRYSLKGANGAARTGMQIIAWDPVVGGIRSWVFDSDGGFGSERWLKDGPRWVLEATGVTREGGQIAATNILTRIDHDGFNWQSVRRSLNDVKLPDTTLIKASRAKTKK